MSAVMSTMPTVADAIEHALEWLDRQGCSNPDHERRNTRRSRYRVAAKVTYHVPGTGKTTVFEVTTRNLSRTGFSFIHKCLIYPRQMLDIQLPLPDRSIRHMKARVVRVRPAGIGMYEIGAEFTELEVAVV